MTKPTPIPPAIAELARLTGFKLRCVECGRTSPPADPAVTSPVERIEVECPGGWRAYRTVDDQVAVYCPSCSAREFGDEAGS